MVQKSWLVTVLLLSCGAVSTVDGGATGGGTAATGGGDATGGGTATGGGGGTTTGLNPAHFVAGALVAGTSISTTSCTLSGGTATTCYQLQLKGAPADHAVGPFCPRHITDGADAGGLWIERGVAYDLTGAFIANLATFYNDSVWQLYDSTTGLVNVTDTQAKCALAARPNVDPSVYNHCVECELSYINGGVSSTVLIPVTPVPLATNAELGRVSAVGVALNGVNFDPPAPTQAILAAHTIAAFDDCGGHVNLNAGYHYHAATGCSAQVAQADGHAPLIGYALDGYGMHAMKNTDNTEPVDLDVCRGHTDAARGYHYHVAGAGENQFIGCFHGQQGSAR